MDRRLITANVDSGRVSSPSESHIHKHFKKFNKKKGGEGDEKEEGEENRPKSSQNEPNTAAKRTGRRPTKVDKFSSKASEKQESCNQLTQEEGAGR